MKSKISELSGLKVCLEKLDPVHDVSHSQDLPYKFSYFMAIHNESLRTVTVMARKWVISSDCGRKQVIEGEGVVGKLPRLAPGDTFRYNSFHLTDGPATAEGAYLTRDDEGELFIVRIPSFRLQPSTS